MVLVIVCWCCQCYLNMLLNWLMFLLCTLDDIVYAAFTVFYVMLKLQCFCFRGCLVYNLCWCFRLFCFRLYSNILFRGFCFNSVFMILLCLLVFYRFNLILMVDCFYYYQFYICHGCCCFICFCFVTNVSDFYFSTLSTIF